MFYFPVPSTSNPTTNTHTPTPLSSLLSEFFLVLEIFLPPSPPKPSFQPWGQLFNSFFNASRLPLLCVCVCVSVSVNVHVCVCVYAPLRDENSSKSDVDDTELTFREQFSHPLKTSGGVGGSNSTQLFKPQRKLAQKGGGEEGLKTVFIFSTHNNSCWKAPPSRGCFFFRGKFLEKHFSSTQPTFNTATPKSTSGGGGKSFPTFHSKLSAFREERWGEAL